MSDAKTGAAGVMKAVAEGSGRLLKTTKLNINLSSEEGKLKAIYVDIGKSVHEFYRHGGSLGGVFDEKYQKILEAEAKIADIKSRLEIAKGIIVCSRCEMQAKRGSAFCPKCGQSLEDNDAGDTYRGEHPSPEVGRDTLARGDCGKESAAMAEHETPPMFIGKICNLCSYENEPTERFCLSCGRAL